MVWLPARRAVPDAPGEPAPGPFDAGAPRDRGSVCRPTAGTLSLRPRPGRDRRRLVCRPGAPLRPDQRPPVRPGVSRGGGAAPRDPHHRQHQPRPLQPPVAQRERPRSRADRPRRGPWIADQHRHLLRRLDGRIQPAGHRVSAFVLAHRGHAERRDAGRPEVRDPGRLRACSLGHWWRVVQRPCCAALWRRPDRGPAGPLGHATSRGGCQAGRVPRRRPRPRGRLRRRPAGVRWALVAGACRRRDGREEPADLDAERARERRAPGRGGRPGAPARRPHRSVGRGPARRQRRRLPRATRPRRGPPPPPDGHRACGRGGGPHPRPDRPDHRRRRLHRFRAGTPGVRDRTAQADPRGSRREPAVHAQARARVTASPGARERRHRHPPRERGQPGRDGAVRRPRGAQRHLPRGRVQARAADGGASVRRDPREHRRHHGDARRCDRGGRGALRVRLDRQGRAPVERHGRQQADRRDAGGRGRAAERPSLRVGPLRERARARTAASSRSSRSSWRTESRSRSRTPT